MAKNNIKKIRAHCIGQMFTFWALRQRFEDELEKAGFPDPARRAVGECFARAVRRYAEDRGFYEIIGS